MAVGDSALWGEGVVGRLVLLEFFQAGAEVSDLAHRAWDCQFPSLGEDDYEVSEGVWVAPNGPKGLKRPLSFEPVEAIVGGYAIVFNFD